MVVGFVLKILFPASARPRPSNGISCDFDGIVVRGLQLNDVDGPLGAMNRAMILWDRDDAVEAARKNYFCRFVI